MWRRWLQGSVLAAVVVSGCAAPVTSQGSSPSAVAGDAGSRPIATASASQGSPPGDAMSSPIAAPCDPAVDMGVLPVWARAGFADPEPEMPHVLSRSGDAVAILFSYPLASPPRVGLNNKILWVHRDGPTSPVEISAQRMEGTTTVGDPAQRSLDGGFAPSIVDLPDAGCWRLTLTYGDRTDSIDLEYAAPTG